MWPVVVAEVLAGIVGADVLAAKIFGHLYRNERRPNAIHYLRTEDGWSLALHRHNPPPGAPAKLPVICCHGLSGNHHGFDLIERTSLARTLAAAGHPTFLLDLRGAGESEKSVDGHPPCWKVSDHYRYDAPAAIRCVRELTGAPRVHWVGHSMGGMIAYAFLQTPLAEQIARCVILSSPSTFDQMRPVHHFAPLLRWLPILPVRTLSQSVAPLFERSRLLQTLGGAVGLAPGVATVFAANCQEQTPSSLIADFARFVRDGHYVDDHGRDLVDGMREIRTPTLFMVGEKDALAMGGSVRTAYEAFGSAEKKYVTLGRSQGHQSDYGHMAVLIGRNAHEEVFPEIVKWLERDA